MNGQTFTARVDNLPAGTPSATAFMTRGKESVWLYAYPEGPHPLVHLRYPAVALTSGAQAVGVVRDIPVRDFAATFDRFEAERVRLQREGWQFKLGGATRVWSNDPWDTADPCTAPCPF